MVMLTQKAGCLYTLRASSLEARWHCSNPQLHGRLVSRQVRRVSGIQELYDLSRPLEVSDRYRLIGRITCAYQT